MLPALLIGGCHDTVAPGASCVILGSARASKRVMNTDISAELCAGGRWDGITVALTVAPRRVLLPAWAFF